MQITLSSEVLTLLDLACDDGKNKTGYVNQILKSVLSNKYKENKTIFIHLNTVQQDRIKFLQNRYNCSFVAAISHAVNDTYHSTKQ